MSTIQKSNALARGLQDFFSDYLPRLRGMSPHTIHSYRDCIVLLLKFVANQQKCSVATLDIENLNTEKVMDFLQMLEEKRRNSSATRNVRLAAIHVFFRYLANKHPDRLDLCQLILAIPFKRTQSQTMEYLEYDEIREILAAVDRTNRDGERDYILLVTMFNTGARVQEILGLKLHDLQLIKPYHAHFFGKGRKERLCPLWPETAYLLKKLLENRGDMLPNESVFLNHRGQPLTRFGVRYLLEKYCDQAKKKCPTLVKKRLHPHTIRHSTAVYLLKSGVDIITISHWLGHANINTTNRYLSVDLDMKRKAINKISSIGTTKKSKILNESVLKWLESL